MDTLLWLCSSVLCLLHGAFPACLVSEPAVIRLLERLEGAISFWVLRIQQYIHGKEQQQTKPATDNENNNLLDVASPGEAGAEEDDRTLESDESSYETRVRHPTTHATKPLGACASDDRLPRMTHARSSNNNNRACRSCKYASSTSSLASSTTTTTSISSQSQRRVRFHSVRVRSYCTSQSLVTSSEDSSCVAGGGDNGSVVSLSTSSLSSSTTSWWDKEREVPLHVFENTHTPSTRSRHRKSHTRKSIVGTPVSSQKALRLAQQFGQAA